MAGPWGGPARATTGEHPRRPQSEAPAALGERGLAQIADLVTRTKAFVDEVYLPDVLYLADIYREEIDHIFDEADLGSDDTADLLADVCQGPGSTPGSSGNP